MSAVDEGVDALDCGNDIRNCRQRGQDGGHCDYNLQAQPELLGSGLYIV